MKFLVPNYSCLQIPVLSVLCPQLNLLNPPEQNSWVRHCPYIRPSERFAAVFCLHLHSLCCSDTCVYLTLDVVRLSSVSSFVSCVQFSINLSVRPSVGCTSHVRCAASVRSDVQRA